MSETMPHLGYKCSTPICNSEVGLHRVRAMSHPRRQFARIPVRFVVEHEHWLLTFDEAFAVGWLDKVLVVRDYHEGLTTEETKGSCLGVGMDRIPLVETEKYFALFLFIFSESIKINKLLMSSRCAARILFWVGVVIIRSEWRRGETVEEGALDDIAFWGKIPQKASCSSAVRLYGSWYEAPSRESHPDEVLIELHVAPKRAGKEAWSKDMSRCSNARDTLTVWGKEVANSVRCPR